MNRIVVLAITMTPCGASAAGFSDWTSRLECRFSGRAASDGPGLPGAEFQDIEWVTIPGGRFAMGAGDSVEGFSEAKPAHMVDITTFEMSKTPVTVRQYKECVDACECTEPAGGGYCNWDEPGRELHPVNCLRWEQAVQYARFKGARLPSESEWEYAARSGGMDLLYPWGNEPATCEKAVMSGDLGDGCGAGGTMPVCSKPAGRTGHGLCDMAGNVWQLLQDAYEYSYEEAPADGRPVEGRGSRKVMRGGSFRDSDAVNLRVYYRSDSYGPLYRPDFIGFRLAKDHTPE
ncbi:MAG: SUMF1/EgtB/PvdO family nonheme iron enzyme [Elusimicrobiales bacterium]|jgi:iron(II)-dependent oxidoreductase